MLTEDWRIQMPINRMRQVIGLELVGQGDVELLLVWFDVDVWTDNIK